MVDAAVKLGLEYVALTDHSVGRAVANGLSVEQLAAHNREIDRVDGEVAGITVLKGTEIDIRADGSLDYDGDVLSELDIVIASIHSAMGQESDVMTNRLISARRNPYVTAIGHLTTRLLWDGLRSRDPISFDATAVFTAAADTGTLLEINSSPKRLDLRDEHIRAAREYGVKFLVNTDSHRPTSFADVRYGVTTARRAGCKRRDVANTLPQTRFLDFLSHSKDERQGFINAVP
jgi:DNA polymerase (family 10)